MPVSVPALSSIAITCTLLVSCAGPPERISPEWAATLPANWSSPVVVLEQARSGWLTTFNDPQLNALVAEAIVKNPDLQASAARIDQALAEARQAGVSLIPQVDATASGSRNQNINRAGAFGGGGFDDFDNFIVNRNNSLGVSLDLTWELDVWGRVKKGQSAAIADSQAATYEFQSARLSLASQVAKAWFSAQEQYLQHQLALETFESFTRTAEITQSRFERGLQSATDVHLSQSSAAAARASLDSTKLEYHQAVRSLEILLGRYPSQELEVTEDLNAVPPPVPAGVPSDLILRRPDLLAAERRLAASDQRVSQARAAFLPRFALTASGGTSSDALRDLADPKHFVWNFLVNLTQPLIDGGSRRADLARNKAAVIEAAENYRGTALTAFKEVEDALDAEGLLESQEAALLDAAEQGRMAYERAESEYSQGLTGIITVLDAQRSYLDSRRNYLTVKRIRLDNRINLHLALGGDFLPGSEFAERSDRIAPTEPPS